MRYGLCVASVQPSDVFALQASLVAALNVILEPVRQHFANDANAKELLRKVKSFKVTR